MLALFSADAHPRLGRQEATVKRSVVVAAAVLMIGGQAFAETPSSSSPKSSSLILDNIIVETIASGLDHPWAIAFLPDGNMLLNERAGRMRLLTREGRMSPPIRGVPTVLRRGQAGLFDLALDRDYGRNHRIYFTYIEPHNDGGRTMAASARLVTDEVPRLEDVKIIFSQQGANGYENNFGSRLVQGLDGNLFITIGDHYTHRDEVQRLDSHVGKIVRIRPDGSAPPGNPFYGKLGALPEIWSYGHRNPQGLAFHPQTGKLWEIEHGPRGGDEVNIVAPGRNYGWPVIGYGTEYSGKPIHASTHRDGMEQPVKYWVPSIAPSGMTFYTGNLFPAWKGSLFVGALAGRTLVRLELAGDHVVREERLLAGLKERIRDVRQAPDGSLWVLTDDKNGRVLRLTPIGNALLPKNNKPG